VSHDAGNGADVSVGIIDTNIDVGTHFATILSGGVYTMVRETNATWRVIGYEALDVK
jgi:hypothetical protein